MEYDIVETYQRRPSAAAYMARVFLPSPGLRPDTPFPRIKARWNSIRIDRQHLLSFVEMTGLPKGRGISLLHSPDTAATSLLYPHVVGFPLHMALLTHRAFPLPVWRMLQTRNHMLLHRPYSEHEMLNLETRVAGQRILAKGLEVNSAFGPFSPRRARMGGAYHVLFSRSLWLRAGSVASGAAAFRRLAGNVLLANAAGRRLAFRGTDRRLQRHPLAELVRAMVRLQSVVQSSSVGDRTGSCALFAPASPGQRLRHG